MRTLMRVAAVVCLAAVAACSGAGRPGRAGADRNMITLAEIQGTRHPNVMRLIQELRPHWLEVRGASTPGGTRLVKRVYLDEMYLGEVEQLRQISTTGIELIRYYDGPAATQRWGVNHSAGVIQIVSGG